MTTVGVVINQMLMIFEDDGCYLVGIVAVLQSLINQVWYHLNHLVKILNNEHSI